MLTRGPDYFLLLQHAVYSIVLLACAGQNGRGDGNHANQINGSVDAV